MTCPSQDNDELLEEYLLPLEFPEMDTFKTSAIFRTIETKVRPENSFIIVMIEMIVFIIIEFVFNGIALRANP